MTFACKGKSESNTDSSEAQTSQGEKNTGTIIIREPVKVRVPTPSSRDALLSKEESIYLTLHANDGHVSLSVGTEAPTSLSLDNIEGGMSEFQKTLENVKEQHPDFDIVLCAEEDVSYPSFKQLISQLQDMGQTRYKIVTLRPNSRNALVR